MTTGRIDQISMYEKGIDSMDSMNWIETTFHTSPYLSCVHSHLAVQSQHFNLALPFINNYQYQLPHHHEVTPNNSNFFFNYEQWNQYYQQELVTHSHLHTTPSLTSYQGHHSQPTHHGNQVTSIVNSS